LQHRVLHDVERIVGIAEGEPCLQKRAPLDTGEKTIQGLRGLQRRFLIIGFSPATLSASSFCPDIRLRRWLLSSAITGILARPGPTPPCNSL
jgi:hypothetical protein